MKFKCYFTAALVCISLSCRSQTERVQDISYSIGGGINYSYLTYNFNNGHSFRTPEIWIRLVLEKPLTSNLILKSGLGFGVKKKTVPYSASTLSTLPYQFLVVKWVDETMSLKDHYFIEIPISLFYDFRKIQVGAGVLGRHYFNNSQGLENDWLSGSYEFGIQPTLSYKLSKNIRLGVDYYFGVTPLFSQITLDGSESQVKNNFFGLNLSYKIR